MTVSPLTAPLDWTSDDPHLSGPFTPIGTEVDAADLRVVAGRIPEDLKGAYLRNGPNPRFQPTSYTYPLEGDGMVHAVRFEGGRARYRNRFVRTASFEVEDKAGHAVFGGLMNRRPADPAALPKDGDHLKQSAFISVLHHGEHLLALGEVEPAWELSPELDTLGPWTAGSGKPLDVGAHNRVHPVTGDLFGLAYDPASPVVHIHRIDRTGRLQASFDVTLAAPSMIHDFVLTERRLVLLIGPAIFDMAAMERGEPLLQWRPEIGTRIAVIDLDGGNLRWIETEACFVFHFANGFERGDEVVIDYVRHERLNIGFRGKRGEPPRLRRLVIAADGKVTDAALLGAGVEFPRIDDRRVARASCFVYVPTRTTTLTLPPGTPSCFNCLVAVDTETGASRQHDFGSRVIGEAVFVPRGPGEADGYLATFVTDPAAGTSDLALLDAAHPDREPVAMIRMPQRVPQGLHGTWVPA
ncbi:MAG: carotenoid oxygenase family protein [Amaricoccus sp.]|uniref:carotenoid oxygenase family protein n=1 Tax=Amaricoccus sp. TaxID=1872485 RepID=UPI00331455C1